MHLPDLLQRVHHALHQPCCASAHAVRVALFLWADDYGCWLVCRPVAADTVNAGVGGDAVDVVLRVLTW